MSTSDRVYSVLLAVVLGIAGAAMLLHELLS